MEPLHASVEELRAFLKHESSPAELIAIGDHLAGCAKCRAVAESVGMGGRLKEALGGEDHLTYEELEGLASGTAIPEHALHCSACAAELEDLRRFRVSLVQRPVGTPARRRWPIWAGAVFATFAAALIFVMTRASHDRKPDVPPARPKAASLQVPGATPDEQRQISEVLQSGELPHAKVLDSLVKNQETLLSGDQTAAMVLKAAAPVATTVLSDRPKFTWNALPGARWYRVAVYGPNFEQIAVSPRIHETVWTPEQPLPRGQILTWTVTGSLATGEVTAPRSPEPEAKFEVLSADDAARMQTVLDRSPHSDLLIAIRANELGLKAEARTAAEAVAGANPGSPVASKLLESARSVR